MSKRTVRFLPATLLLALTASAGHAQLVYVEGSNDHLGLLNVQSGAYTSIGITTERLGGLGLAPDGNLYGLGDNRILYRVNTSSGAITNLGNIGVSISSYAFGAGKDGTLFLTNPGTLYTIDPTTVHATSIGSLGFNNAGGVTTDAANNLFSVQGPAGTGFYRLNRTNGAGTLISNLSGIGTIDGLAFTQGSLYAINTTGSIYSLNTTTGAATFVHSYDTNTVGVVYSAGSIFNAAPVPEISTLLSLSSLVTLGGLVLLRRRKQAIG